MTLSQRFTELEAIIDVGLATFVDVGHALSEIRESKFYHELGYSAFSDYCDERWKPRLTMRRANQLIEAAQTVEVMGNMFPTSELPVNARQASALAPLAKSDPQAAAEVLEEVRREKGANATARDFQDAVRAKQGKPPITRAIEPDAHQPEPPDDFDSDRWSVEEDYAPVPIPTPASMEIVDEAGNTFTLGGSSRLGALEDAVGSTEEPTGPPVTPFGPKQVPVTDLPPDIQRDAERLDFDRRVVRVYRLITSLKPEYVADTLEKEDYQSARYLIASVRKWLDQFESSLGRGLRVVGGRDE